MSDEVEEKPKKAGPVQNEEASGDDTESVKTIKTSTGVKSFPVKKKVNPNEDPKALQVRISELEDELGTVKKEKGEIEQALTQFRKTPKAGSLWNEFCEFVGMPNLKD